MAEIDLKEYTSRAKELETAIFTQKCLMHRYKEVLEAQFPIAPQMRKVQKPIKPDPDHYRIFKQASLVWVSIAVMCMIGLYGLCMVFAGSVGGIVGVLFGILAILVTRDEIRTSKDIAERNQELAEEYNQAEREYLRQIKEYNRQLELSKEDYEQALAVYKQKTAEYNESYNVILRYHNASLTVLENALQALYDENVIFPKYRNLVAITTINEYLLSGRCYCLEGPDGAYNLYEMELRKNIVIGQLSDIIDDPEKLRGNQYSLYEALRRSNAIIDSIVRELRDDQSDTQLTAYFAENIALADKDFCII